MEPHPTDKRWQQPPCKICKWALGHNDKCPAYFKELRKLGCITEKEFRSRLINNET